MASFQIKAGAEENAHFPQGPKAPNLPKVRKGGVGAHHVPKLRVLQGHAGKRRARQTHQERSQTQRKGVEIKGTWQVGI